jgi:hypothetical protein
MDMPETPVEFAFCQLLLAQMDKKLMEMVIAFLQLLKLYVHLDT